MRILKGSIKGDDEKYVSPGSFVWTPPDETVTSVCVLCVGGGGGGIYPLTDTAQSGCGGGALSYTNNVSVTFGKDYVVTVGAGGGLTGEDGGDSSFAISGGSTVVLAKGGKGSVNLGQGGQASAGIGVVKYSGGDGGALGEGPGGGGAAGYAGPGGTGGTSETILPTDGQGGGGGGGGATDHVSFGYTSRGGGGGGVGVMGQGSDGAAGESGGFAYRGGAGSGGFYDQRYVVPGDSTGGDYGGGAGGCYYAYINDFYPYGGNGAVRIIWGTGRAFPSTGTGEY